jgi:3-mercaptopyruvate sulfurtransferase SseA
MANGPIPLSTEELRILVGNPQVQIVDVRPIDAYNGWRLRDEVRGGHVRGARTLPARWSAYLDWIEIVRAKGIAPDQTLVAYGYDREETECVAGLFLRAGWEQVRVYHDFAGEWCADDRLPMDPPGPSEISCSGTPTCTCSPPAAASPQTAPSSACPDGTPRS